MEDDKKWHRRGGLLIRLRQYFFLPYCQVNTDILPGLQSELPDVKALQSDPSVPPLYVLLWMGSKNSAAPLHYDKSENFHLQITGAKRFILAPPEEFDKIHLFPATHPQRLQTQIDTRFKVNTTKFPKFRKVRVIEGLLGPGEVLYLPPFWFHYVFTEEPGLFPTCYKFIT